jgi:cytochrome P450
MDSASHAPPRPAHAAAPPVSLARYPDESWLFGGTRALMRNGLEFVEQCERTAGIVHTRFAAVKRLYVVSEPSAIEDVLVNHPHSFVKPFMLRRMKMLFGNGLLTAEGDRWTHNRHLVQPAFHSERMPGFIHFVRENTEALASSWRHDEIRDVYPDLVDLCLKNLARTMFGVFDDDLERRVRALATACQAMMHAVLRTVPLLPLLYPSRLKRDLRQALRDLDDYLGRLIDERSHEPPRDDFLGLLMSGGGGHHPPMSRQAVLDESVTMLLAGHETAATALVWGLYLLARHPEHADALAADLVARLHGEAPTVCDLDGLASLRATLDETLRLYPPTHRIGRTVKEPVVVGGHRLPVGADVLLSQWAVHRSARWYAQPEVFMPGRWTPAFRHALPKFAYFPFSGGPRACVGSHFVWFESAVILGVLAQRFRFSRPDGAPPLVPYEGLTLTPAGGQLRLRIEHRDRSAG